MPVDDPQAFLHFLRAGFAQPRKQLHNSLAKGLDLAACDVQQTVREAGIDPTRRPGDLSLVEWANLYERLPITAGH